MKKFLATLLAVCMIATSMVFIPRTVAAEDASETITVTDAESLNQAVKDIANGGTIVVSGDIVVAQTSNGHFVIGSGTGKTYTITGGSFDFTALTSTDSERGFVDIKDNITFENTTFKFDSEKNDYLFGNGYSITIAETVAFEGNKILFYAGILNGNCNSINVNIFSGTYSTINCATNSAKTISGDINFHIGGTVVVNDVLGNSGGCTVNGNVTILIDGNASVSGAYGGGNGGTVNGNTYVTVGGNATVNQLFGGGSGGTIDGNTYVIVEGNATAKKIYGGGNSGTIKGSTYVTLKDNANPNHTVSTEDHSKGYVVYGGGKGYTKTNAETQEVTTHGSIIEGSTNVTIKDNAKSNYIFGGSTGPGCTIVEGSHINMCGGAAYSLYAGSENIDHGSGANVAMTNGTVHQLFGGNEASSLTGDVTVRLLGGTILRRVFGGCYNDYATDILEGKWGWQSDYNVSGNINLFISENANLLLNSESDNALSAHSRRNDVASAEIASIIYTSSNAKTKYSNKVSAGSFSSGKTPNYTHCLDYTISDNVITQTCSCGVNATATITPNGNVYTGNEIGVSIVYSDNWEFEKFDVSYANNVNAGTATATLTISDFTTQTYNYSIAKLSQKEPSVRANGNKIAGLTTDMEYSTDGKTYTKVSDANMTFENGKYLVRYAESTNASLSRATMVYIYTGAYCVSANKANAVQGGTVDVFVQIPVNSGLDNINVTVGYDKLALTLEGFTAGKFEGATLEGNVISWSGDNTAKTGTLAKLTFAVKEDAELGDYEITLSAEGFSVVNGGISVSEFVHGDVNGDGGKINVSDIISLRGAVVDESTDDLARGADVNGDGIVNSQDIIIIRKYLANYNYTTGESSVVLGAAQ